MPSESLVSPVIVPVDSGRFDDLQTVLNGGGDGPSCQCMWQLIRAKEWAAISVDEKRARLRAEVEAADPSPGLLAYVDGEPVGWVRVGPRPPQERIVASKIVASGSREPLDDPSVWAVTCFSVRREYRGEGIVGELLAAAVEAARAGGARVLEAYPFDLAAGKRSSNELYHGALSTFESAGFAVVARPTPARAVVARKL
jgi:ribosomal protein S18 acetylase RimI-like enzyme